MGRLLGVGGGTLKALQEVTNCSIKIDSRNDRNGREKTFRCVKISSRDSNQSQREAGIERCTRAVQILCGEEDMELSEALSRAMAEEEAYAQEEQVSRQKMLETEAVSNVSSKCGDKFSHDAIKEALAKENWDPNEAMNRLFDEYHHAEYKHNLIKPVLNAQKLLDAARSANAARKAKESESCSFPSNLGQKTKDADDCNPSKDVMRIRDVFAQARAKGLKLQSK
jgi:hypothetical protein